jgi:ankyrin repeat protein
VLAATLLVVPFAASAADTQPATDWHYTLSIHEIVRADDLDRLNPLLADSPDRANLRNADGSTPVHIAVANASLRSLKALAAAKADLNAPDGRGRTPLSIALDAGFTTLFNTLLDLGADASREAWSENTPAGTLDAPLTIAARNGNLDLLKAMLAAKPSIDRPAKNGTTALTAAAAAGRWDAVDLLVASGANVNAPGINGNTALAYAVAAKNEAAVSGLLGKNANLNTRIAGATLVMRATTDNQDKILSLLLGKGADPNTRSGDNVAPLHRAVVDKHDALVNILLDRGADPNLRYPDGTTPLVRATADNSEAIVKLLLDKGADPNARLEGDTPLARATVDKREALVALLVAKHADPNVRLRDGSTPLIRATRDNEEKIVELLLAGGADPKLAMPDGRTALTFTEAPALWKMLLAKGADINTPVRGRPPLHTFIAESRLDLIELFLPFRPDPLITDRQGHTAKELAREAAKQKTEDYDLDMRRRRIAQLVETYQRQYAADELDMPAPSSQPATAPDTQKSPA